MKHSGLTAYIYRSKHSKCTLNKLNEADTVTIIDDAIPPIFTADEQHPAVRIVRRKLHWGDYIHAEPIDPGNYMFGGSYIFCSDSRISELNKYPIPLHDRVEL